MYQLNITIFYFFSVLILFHISSFRLFFHFRFSFLFCLLFSLFFFSADIYFFLSYFLFLFLCVFFVFCFVLFCLLLCLFLCYEHSKGCSILYCLFSHCSRYMLFLNFNSVYFEKEVTAVRVAKFPPGCNSFRR